MSDEQNIERSEAEVEGHAIRGSYKPEQDVEGHPLRWGSDSEAPDNTDVTDADAAEESEVEGQGIRWGKDEAPEDTDADETDEPEVDGQASRFNG